MYARSNGAFISINCSSGKPLCKYLLFRPQLSSKRHLLDYLVNHYFVQMGNSGVSGTNLALTSDPPMVRGGLRLLARADSYERGGLRSALQLTNPSQL